MANGSNSEKASTDAGGTVAHETILHASCVAVDGRALLVLGASGSGKSTVALDLISLGATLVADDRTVVRSDTSGLIVSPPSPIAGRIEARNVGLLRLPYCAEAELVLALDLDRTEEHRLPPRRETTILGQTVTLLYRPPAVHFASALLHCLRNRRETP
ncbi:HPr kinase/phosphorylase [Tropicimonas marinistellae]|uniref:HPr kinase/phosphorylase n=1 Tax=Tropicimonas marinistellae TaxID=1739787 RepID=UPI00098E9A3E|nr:HPr kinase/phosphatase C-terminal domain-containing protein [Tropicimonas marinistellae]